MKPIKGIKIIKGLAASAFVALNLSVSAYALSLRDAVVIAVDSNPEIGQSMANREAVEFELRQALGLYMPRVDLEVSTGIQRLDNPSRRFSGIQDDPLYPTQVDVIVSHDIWDGGFRKAEANRQAARVDGASFRVLERSEFIGLEVSREYFQVLLQQRVVNIARQNVGFHEQTRSDVRAAVDNGQLTAADSQQVEERLSQARARLTEAREALDLAQIGFYKLVYAPFEAGQMPSRISRSFLPNSLSQAIGQARSNNPRLLMASADIDAAAAVVEQSRSGLNPTINLQGRASAGYDVNGVDGATNDLQVKLSLKWNLYDGGIKRAEIQENARRETEVALGQQQVLREVEEAVRISWTRMGRQGSLSAQYGAQLKASSDLVESYRSQFSVNQRSLLDVLDAQNTRFNVQVLYETAQYSQRFAEYRLLAATGRLLEYLGLDAPSQSNAYAREKLKTPSADSYQPRKLEPVNFEEPIDLTSFVN